METIAHSTSAKRGVLTTNPPRGSITVPASGRALAIGTLRCPRPIVEFRALSERFVIILATRHGRGVHRVDAVRVRIGGRRPVSSGQIGNVFIWLRVWPGWMLHTGGACK